MNDRFGGLDTSMLVLIISGGEDLKQKKKSPFYSCLLSKFFSHLCTAFPKRKFTFLLAGITALLC